MEVLMLYLFISVMCAIILLFTLIFGDFMDTDFDMDLDLDVDVDVDYGDFTGAGVSPLSLPVILIFFASFGAFGGILEALELVDSLLVPIIATLGGFIMAGGMYLLLVKVFIKSQATTVVTKKDLIGKIGQVTVPITPGKTGQILVITEARGRTLKDAVASENIPSQAEVKIVGFSGECVRVEKVGD